ncbi:ShlB/FhaC/HecB family hemolysin secretion/activation protein [Pseudooceanicola sp.]|uniref:ShlB/FhaC/HecB family hemolysin secretion/activation protein n=1 Tax=Pseudooceanicola sp. TaxID=1914328 RepID=UPI0035C6E472
MSLLGAVALGAPALAQTTAADVTPESFTPSLQRLNGAVVFTGRVGTSAPAGSDAIGITLSGVSLANPLPQMAAANQAYVDRLTRGRIPVSELFEATSDLEAAYADAGFILSRVVLPQQQLRDGGQLQVRVVNGYVEKIDTTQVPENIRPRIDALTSGLVDRRGLSQAELERKLLLAGDVPGTALRSALAPGSDTGATVIGLDPEYKTITGFVGFNNEAGSQLGGASLDFGIDANSAFGLGETLYARLSAAPQGVFSNNPRSRVLAFGGVLPVGTSGASVNLEFTVSDTTPDNPLAPTRSDFDRQSLRVLYPFIRGRQLNLSGQLALDLQQDRQAVLGGADIYRDRLTVLRATANLTYLGENNAFTSADMTLSQGIDAFGARTLADVGGGTPLSRAGADATFTKLAAGFSHNRRLSENLSLALSGKAQTSFGQALPGSEQFSLVGNAALSSFDSGGLKGDSGWLLRAELSTSMDTQAADLPLRLSPYLFLAGGVAYLDQPTALEQARTSAVAYGIGIDIFSSRNSSFRSSSIRIELGRGERNDAVPDDNRFSISGTFRF